MEVQWFTVKMPDDLKEAAVQAGIAAIEKVKHIDEMAFEIRKRFEEQFTGHWFVFVTDTGFSYVVSHAPQGFITLQVNEWKIMIVRAPAF